MSEPPTVRVENQLIRFVPPEPVELDVAVSKLGAIRQDDYAVHTLATPRATIIVDKEGRIVIHGTNRMEVARHAAKEFLLQLGRSDDGLKAELGGIIASFKFANQLNMPRLMKKLGKDVEKDERLDCVKVNDTRHNITLYVWSNGKVIVENATHANLVAMAAVYWQERLIEEKIMMESDSDSEAD
ncbi:MAG: hypothetical protein CMA27_03725 [Euryarchaeota archaeon]|nr:hypothetical protein [Euryarchaeota archaeon]